MSTVDPCTATNCTNAYIPEYGSDLNLYSIESEVLDPLSKSNCLITMANLNFSAANWETSFVRMLKRY